MIFLRLSGLLSLNGFHEGTFAVKFVALRSNDSFYRLLLTALYAIIVSWV